MIYAMRPMTNAEKIGLRININIFLDVLYLVWKRLALIKKYLRESLSNQ